MHSVKNKDNTGKNVSLKSFQSFIPNFRRYPARGARPGGGWFFRESISLMASIKNSLKIRFIVETDVFVMERNQVFAQSL